MLILSGAWGILITATGNLEAFAFCEEWLVFRAKMKSSRMQRPLAHGHPQKHLLPERQNALQCAFVCILSGNERSSVMAIPFS